MMTTIEGNKLIAEFMGGKIQPDDSCANYTKMSIPYWAFRLYNFDTMSIGGYEYHTSWDWLMPVVHKIECMDSDKIDSRVTIERQECRIYFDSDSGKYEWMFGGLPKIESTWKSIVRFIQWFNNQKQ